MRGKPVEINALKKRWGLGGTNVKTDGIDHINYIYCCGSFENIDRFLFNESICITRQEISDLKKFCDYQDGLLSDYFMEDLDQKFINAVNGVSCKKELCYG